MRSISRAAIPFLFASISKSTNSQMRTLTFVPWKMVPVRTLNCFRQGVEPHFHRRRMVCVLRVRVVRLIPLAGLRK